MSVSAISYLFLTATIALSVYSQIMIKWRLSTKFAGIAFPDLWYDRLIFLLSVIFDPFIFSALCATFLSGLFWIATLTKLDLSYAYPFMSLGFLFVLLLSALLLGESFSAYKVIGAGCIILGVYISSQG